MRLSCKRGMQIAVYSAMFGRTQQGTLECPLHHRRAPSVGEPPSHSHTGRSRAVDWLDPQDAVTSKLSLNLSEGLSFFKLH